MKMKPLIIFTLLLSVFQVKAEETCYRKVQDDGARKSAISFLSHEETGSEYEKYPESTVEEGCFWIVTFKHKEWETKKPSRGIVKVHKTTGKAQWLPSK
jgi:hypothetical protein